MPELPNLVSDKSPSQSLLTTLAIITIGFAFIGPMVGMLMVSPFYDGDLLSDFTSIESVDDKRALFYPMMIVQGVGSFVGFILLPYFQLTVLGHRSVRPFFPLVSRPVIFYVLLVILSFNFIIALTPVVEWNSSVAFPEFLKGFENWARSSEDRMASYTEVLTGFDSPLNVLLGIFVIALIPAIGEELVFRGMVQNELWRGTRNVHLAIWLSAAIFSAIHMQFFGFFPRLLLGALFGYLYYWSGDLRIPIIAHFVNNAISVFAIYLDQRGVIEITEKIETPPWPAVITGVVVTVALLFYLWKFFRDHRPLTHDDPAVLK